MALREKLTKPLVLGPAGGQHTHTVDFLHLFEAISDDDAFRSRVLAAKQTKDHRTLAAQFPTVRWVFPYPKKGSVLHWSNLSAQEKRELGLALPGVPYVIQIILQEADRVGGLDKIILGGQGKTAEAAHDAVSSFPESPVSSATPEKNSVVLIAEHIQKHFHPAWTGFADLKMAGFVGMHVPTTGQGAQVTRDVRNFGIQSKITWKECVGINNTIIRNTAHKFIHGGYKTHAMTRDRRRIDDFAAFLEDQVGVDPAIPRDRAKDELSEKQKYALEFMRHKEENEKQKNILLRRIEADKVERTIRRAQEREARFYRTQAKQGQNPHQEDEGH